MISVASELLRHLDASPKTAQQQYRDQLGQLTVMFPDLEESALDGILKSMDSDLERAVVVMYSPHSPYHKKPALPAPSERLPAPDFAYMTNPWLASAPLATATVPPQTSPRAQVLADMIRAPSQPLPKCEDMPMEDLAVPDLVAPPPEEPTSKPSSPITPWAPSLEDIDAQKDVAYLWHMFPKISDEFLLHALEEGSGDPAATVAWAMAINDASRVQDIISDAFPTAPPEEVQEALLSKNSNATTAYMLLARKHQSAWDRDHFTLSSQIAQKLLVMDKTLAPEFHDPDPSYAQHKAKWWDTMMATKEYKVADSAQKTANWTRVTAIASSTIDVTPWVAGHVESLGAWRTDKTAFNWAMSTLRTFHDVTALTNYCANHPGSTESTLDIVLALLEDGLASPGAAAWAMEHLSKSPQAYRVARFHFAAYGANRCTLWN